MKMIRRSGLSSFGKSFFDRFEVRNSDSVSRNPWGKRSWNGVGEWNGPWSDGSKEWTPYWIKKLNHRFGDDGEFWMSYNDLCRKFETLHRTRLFDDTWVVVQQWTSVNVSWVSGYLTTKFVIEIHKAGTVVIVLSQVRDLTCRMRSTSNSNML